MQVSTIYEQLDALSPFTLQEKWDNSGLNLGSLKNRFQRIYATLEVDLSMAHQVQEHSLIIAHHPLIFSPLKHLNPEYYPCNIASILLAKHCSLIAMHTNFDCTHLNLHFAKEILGFESLVQQSFALHTSIPPTSFESLIQRIKNKMQTSHLKAVKSSPSISQVYIVCGSGMSALSIIPPHSDSCLITGDIKHHQAMEAQSLGISLIDVGHFESEKYFAKILYKILQNLGYEVIIPNLENPLKSY
ncbi:Nif3-like dinuclear metal center hexameric protein [Helicobacter enhydrae]|uniref:GTP cyclohydrolase 1 type 2 homolog n=1 Tax=Helicobacter enhydrae TaxID=222136 RepID=A0A1B1U6I3_9HELI|nr:Nif3-like dinuclear metal center hexameric protein [Helicobacter enhydrae]ANV98407.1 Nif3-like dinuclear metal center hexameric protein [Helicobacter enhydrae]